ncbi:MAG: aldo/keto reductase [Pseudomonadota bacterium]
MSATRLCLGGAQFGLDYGLTNAAGRIAPHEAARMLAAALAAGVDMIDVAPAYGDAEAAVAAARPAEGDLRVVSKTRVGAASIAEIEAAARRSAALAGGALDALLVHHAAELSGPQGAELWRLLERLKADGTARRIGFSAYVEDDPAALCARFRPDVAQIPFSLLDQRLLRSGALARMRALGVEIHARSVYLQGLVFMRPEDAPPKLAPIAPRLRQIQAAIAAAGVAPGAAALGFALSRPELARVIVGCASCAQLQEAAALAGRPPPALDWGALSLDADWALSPANW